MLLLRVVEALRRFRVPHAVVGGYAVALHGAVRGTVDIDLVLRFRERDFTAAERALARLSLMPRLPVSAQEMFRFREEYLRNRNLTAWSFVNAVNPSEIVDVILTHNLEEMRVKRIVVEGKRIDIASIEDLIRMKQASGRPQDLEDVRALKRLR